jgi:hypothetical protein
MSVFQVIMLCAVAASAAVSYGNKRGLLWLACLTLSYLISSTYWRSGLPSAEILAGVCDAACVLAVYFIARYHWEMVVGVLFLTALLVNAIYAGFPFDHGIYSTILELLNGLVIIGIGGVSAFQGHGKTDGWAYRAWGHIFGFARPAHISVARDKH